METARPTLALFCSRKSSQLCSINRGSWSWCATYLGVVELTGKSDLHHGDNSLLEQNAELALAVDLGSEAAGSEIVLGTESGRSLLPDATHHATLSSTSGSELKAEVDTSLELVGQSLPVRSLQTTSGHELSASNPVIALVLSGIADHALGAHACGRSLVDSLETQGQSWSDALQVATDEDSSKRAFEDGRVHGLDLGGEVVASIVVLKRELSAAGASCRGCLDLSGGLCDPSGSPAVVESSGEGEIAVEVTLAEDLEERVLASRVARNRGPCGVRTLLVPKRAKKAYGGICCEPWEKACETWKRGATLKALVRSARRPEKDRLLRKTSRCTSFATFSTVPGLDSPRASLRAWNEVYVSLRVDTMALFDRASRAPDDGDDDGFSNSVGTWIEVMMAGGGAKRKARWRRTNSSQHNLADEEPVLSRAGDKGEQNRRVVPGNQHVCAKGAMGFGVAGLEVRVVRATLCCAVCCACAAPRARSFWKLFWSRL